MKTRSVRIPDDIDEALAAAAEAEHISVQARIVQALERDLASRGQYRGAGHAERVAAALESIQARRGPGYSQAMQAAEDAHRGVGRQSKKAS
jgi:predicted transcriptional regulator